MKVSKAKSTDVQAESPREHSGDVIVMSLVDYRPAEGADYFTGRSP
jgi:hypothetical protein